MNDLHSGQIHENRTLYRITLPFCDSNQDIVSKFIKRLDEFTQNDYKFFVTWKTRKICTLFPFKDKRMHRVCVIYQGICDCGNNYVGETERNDILRIQEHEDIRKKSEPARHLTDNFGHSFTWSIIRNAPCFKSLREIIEAFYIAQLRPTLNRQLARELKLFRNGIT